MAMSSEKVLRRLIRAQEDQAPINIRRRRLVDGTVRGFVVSIAREWVAIQALADSVYDDGYEILRMADITSAKVDPSADYVMRGVSALGRAEPDVHLPPKADVPDVLRIAADHAQLIGFHSEQYENEPMWIGQLGRLGKKTFDLLFIDVNGVWSAEPDRWPYKDVSRISFGGRYYEALERFGDPTPTPEG